MTQAVKQAVKNAMKPAGHPAVKALKRALMPVTAVLVGASCAHHPPAGAEAHPAQSVDAHWSYEGDLGPAAWGTLEPEYAACSSGKEQSPIDLTAAKQETQPPVPLRFAYHPAPGTTTNNGHAIEVSFAAGDTLDVGGVPYRLLQFHYHHPSEHTINGRGAPLEIHFVHRNEAGQLAVLGGLVREGARNSGLGAFLAAPGSAATLDVTTLLPPDRSHFAYPGSLTTPPCTEGVTWLVLASGITADHDQLEALRHLVPSNARPLQKLGGRVLIRR
jgi:carbonic anhydrase